jgi:exo-beta-1,3-glucanase (GH17 family)
MSVSTSSSSSSLSSSSSSEIFSLSLTIKTRLYHSFFLSTMRTKSLCWDHHRESLDCRLMRSFVSIHSHQQHHPHQKHWMCCNL